MHMKPALLSVFLVALALGACASGTSGAKQSATAGQTAPTPDTCDAGAAQSIIGQAYTDDLAERARILSGATSVRRIGAGQMMTMEFEAARLSVELDEAGKVAAVRCG
jgi:hypothetical protein